MAIPGLSNQPFFADKSRAFWILQTIGWSFYFMLRLASGVGAGMSLSWVVPLLVSTATGYSLTLIMGGIFRWLISRRPLVTWGLSVVTFIIAILIHSMVDAWVFNLLEREGAEFNGALFLSAISLNSLLLGAWAALYYGINFYLIIEEQADQLLKLENQATSAQLAMLRYQLNPHFLFNTLNSISTLVLLKQTEPANAMLSRLSSFLRYTLVNEPTGRVTVAQEVDTLKLYLDIERMRFEDRLRTDFQIEPDTANALLPSLLLQPLVENAIKYAVSPQELGAEITIAAQLVGPNLRITVSDTGPGLQSGGSNNRLTGVTFDGGEQVSTGVGLANIRDRLAQAYGEDHRFETMEPPEGGFAVLIEIPFERREPATPAAAADKRPALAG